MDEWIMALHRGLHDPIPHSCTLGSPSISETVRRLRRKTTACRLAIMEWYRIYIYVVYIYILQLYIYMYTYVLNIWKNLGTGMRAIHLQDFSNLHGAPYLSLLEHMMHMMQWPRSSRGETSEFLLLDLVECRGIQRCRGLVRNRVELVICEVPLQRTLMKLSQP